MKTTLREANVVLDNYEVTEVTEFKYFDNQNCIRLERADEMEFEFDLNIILDLSDGSAYADDLAGEEHNLVFWVHHLLGETF